MAKISLYHLADLSKPEGRKGFGGKPAIPNYPTNEEKDAKTESEAQEEAQSDEASETEEEEEEFWEPEQQAWPRATIISF